MLLVMKHPKVHTTVITCVYHLFLDVLHCFCRRTCMLIYKLCIFTAYRAHYTMHTMRPMHTTLCRVMEWLRHVDLSEYAPNLRGSGVHGALLVLEKRWENVLN